jgi:hypothetical protein
LDSDQRYKPDVRHKPLTLTKNALSNQSSIETPQGGTLLDDEAGPLEKDHPLDGARSAQGGFQKSTTTSWARTRGDARIGAGDPPQRDNTSRKLRPADQTKPSWKQRERKKEKK